MTGNRMVELLEIELLCVKKNVYNACDRDCEHCELAQDAEEVIKMYSRVIEILKSNMDMELIHCEDCLHRGEDACPMHHTEPYYHEGWQEWDEIVDDYTRDTGFCDRAVRQEAEPE